MSAEESKL